MYNLSYNAHTNMHNQTHTSTRMHAYEYMQNSHALLHGNPHIQINKQNIFLPRTSRLHCNHCNDNMKFFLKINFVNIYIFQN